MGIDILDLFFRLERRFGIRIARDEVEALLEKNHPPDVTAGELFDFVRQKAGETGVLDTEADAESLWPMFQQAVSDALGVEEDEVTKNRWILHDLGAR